MTETEIDSLIFERNELLRLLKESDQIREQLRIDFLKDRDELRELISELNLKVEYLRQQLQKEITKSSDDIEQMKLDQRFNEGLS